MSVASIKAMPMPQTTPPISCECEVFGFMILPQEMGGVVWGIGMALMEATDIDHRFGRMMTSTLADYHVPVNADVHSIETDFVEEDDLIVNPLGVKGMGELGMLGIPAAIANAVFHATGNRIRGLPITPDNLL